MNYIDQIFERANIQHIREFVLRGTDCMRLETAAYKERLRAAENVVISALHDKFSDDDEFEAIIGKIYDYSDATKNVYMEIGMRIGGRLTSQLLNL